MTPPEIINKFLKDNPSIAKVEWEHSDLTIWFQDSKEPWGIGEFTPGTDTGDLLEQLEADLLDSERIDFIQ
jgi:hypothetical protein